MDKKNKQMKSLIIGFVLMMVLSVITHTVHANSKARIIKTGGVGMGIAVDLNRDGEISFDLDQPRVDNDGNIVEAKSAKDKTHPSLPYRFWINNNLDVVNDDAVIRLNLTSCKGKNNFVIGQEYEQQCEQWDEDPNKAGYTNTSQNRLSKIESYKDLEDFSPMIIKINPTVPMADSYWQLKIVGTSVNLFKGEWTNDSAHAYIYKQGDNTLDPDKQTVRGTAIEQVYSANKDGYFRLLKKGDKYKLTPEDINKFFDENGVGKFIFEGVDASDSACASNAAGCYIEINLFNKKDDKPLGVASTVHLDLHDIEDYYDLVTAGESAQKTGEYYQIEVGEDEFSDPVVITQLAAFHANYNNETVTTQRVRELNIYNGLFAPSDITKDYIIQTHGWRVLDSEKKSFSDTSFKRLYWSGYKGQMGALNWPTGWFDKPANVYSTLGLLTYVLGNERNYNISEIVARQVGVNLVDWLRVQKQTGSRIHAIAHSMGNVVISEAIRNSSGESLLSSYSASQSAIDAGSYDSNAPDISHKLQPIALTCLGDLGKDDVVDPESAWRCYNIDSFPDTPYDMPPDMYRYDLIVRDEFGNPELDASDNYIIRHGQTRKETMGAYIVPEGGEPGHYLAGIGTESRIINFYNSDDAALNAWEFNQLTKPDALQGDDWHYSNNYLDDLNTFNNCDPEFDGPCDEPELPLEVTSTFKEGDIDVPFKASTWFKILAHAIPARTKAVGQSNMLIVAGQALMSGFTDSNQDHSAPYYGYYAEKTITPLALTGQQRAAYWNEILSESLGLLKVSGDYTGLKNDIENVEQ